MSRLIFLDAGPLGLLSNANGKPRADDCRRWVQRLTNRGIRIFVPEIADYEVRRELIRVRAKAGIGRLDQVAALLDYVPLSTEAMLLAAELWAKARQDGKPTAGPDSLDADCILAAQAIASAGPDDEVVVATTNVGHLARFVEARTWEEIAP